MLIFRFMFRRFFYIALTAALSALYGFGRHANAETAVDVLAKPFYAYARQKTGFTNPNDRRPPSLSTSEALALYSPAQQKPGFGACSNQFPNNQPLNPASLVPDMQLIALCSNHFAVVYSAKSKTPLVVVERLSGRQIGDAKGEQRTNQFFPDPRLPSHARAELSDYRGSGLDRGHTAPAGNQPDQISMGQSFALSNMVPQDRTHNQKIWNRVEQDVRKFVSRAGGYVYVYTGPLFQSGHDTIGASRVWVPTHLYKLVYDEASRRAWAYVLPNAPDVRIERPVDYPTFVKITGLPLLTNVPVSGSVEHRR